MSHLQREIDMWVAKTLKSAAAHRKASRHVPGGVSSNFRFMDPYPMFVSRARGSRIFDLDGNEFIDFMLSMGSLLVGHSHPAVVKAITEQPQSGAPSNVCRTSSSMRSRHSGDVWTVSIVHTKEDIEAHLGAFERIAPLFR